MRIAHDPLGIERENGVSQLPPRAMIAAAMVLASAFSQTVSISNSFYKSIITKTASLIEQQPFIH